MGWQGIFRRNGRCWLLLALVAFGCGGGIAAAAPAGPVQVLYAGSLVDLMEHDLGPAFQRRSGVAFWGEGKGSKSLAHEISGQLRRADVFISASPSVNQELMGKDNGDWVQWYAAFASSPVVIAYNPQSRFAADFRSKPWYQVLAEPGIRIGRTDPQLDPKGTRTLELLDAAATAYARPGLRATVLGGDENPKQVFPETDLVGRLQAGQLDAGFFYELEAVERGLPFVKPAAEVDPQAVYTVAIVRDAPHPEAAWAFIGYLLSEAGRAALVENGLEPLALEFHGDEAAIAAARQRLESGS